MPKLIGLVGKNSRKMLKNKERSSCLSMSCIITTLSYNQVPSWKHFPENKHKLPVLEYIVIDGIVAIIPLKLLKIQ